MGKGKRSGKWMVSVEEEDDLAGLEDVSSDGEDDNYDTELTDNETASTGAAFIRRCYRKRVRGADTSEKAPLMEGEGKHLRVMGFNQSQRAVFLQILMRFGISKAGWGEFAKRLKQKTYEEIKNYGVCFLHHINEEITDSPTFSDGVPKEGLRVDDVLVRMGTLILIREKLEALSKGSIFFTDDIISRYPGLKGGRIWKQPHDRLLLEAVMKHGYGRWQAIVDDKDLRIQEVICQELNLPFINTTTPGGPAQNSGSVISQAQFHLPASGVSQQHIPTTGNQAKGTTGGNHVEADVAQGATNTLGRTQPFQDQSALYHFREMQRRQVEFIKKRVLLLEKGLVAELQKVVYADKKRNDTPNDEIGLKVTDVNYPSSEALNAKMIAQMPQVETISPEEISTFACDKNSNRLDMASLYNEICGIVAHNAPDSSEAHNSRGSMKLKRNLGSLEG